MRNINSNVKQITLFKNLTRSSPLKSKKKKFSRLVKSRLSLKNAFSNHAFYIYINQIRFPLLLTEIDFDTYM